MRLQTIGLIVTLVLASLVAPVVPEAQPPGKKVPHIGILTPAPGPSPLFAVFRHGLRELGYVEGQNLLITYRSAEGQYERLPDLAAELVRLKVDILVTQGTPTTQVAKRATRTIPIVVTTTGDPVAAGLVASWARPGATSPASASWRPS